mgnify:CR=1 FL=1
MDMKAFWNSLNIYEKNNLRILVLSVDVDELKKGTNIMDMNLMQYDMDARVYTQLNKIKNDKKLPHEFKYLNVIISDTFRYPRLGKHAKAVIKKFALEKGLIKKTDKLLYYQI